MIENGKKIQEYFDILQHDLSLGFEECIHKYSQNGTISCIKCGKIKHSIASQIYDHIQNYTEHEKPNLL
jgi:hypothetical protein